MKNRMKNRSIIRDVFNNYGFVEIGILLEHTMRLDRLMKENYVEYKYLGWNSGVSLYRFEGTFVSLKKVMIKMLNEEQSEIVMKNFVRLS